jgi:predicted branched-subunit amino acid permease
MMAAGASMAEIVLTTLILNFRHFIMTSSLSQRMPATVSNGFLAVLAFGVTDESFAVASIRPEPILDPLSMFGLNLTAYLAWNTGTILGLVMGDAIPEALAASMGIALYAMFVGLLIPGLKSSRPMVVVALIAIVTSTLIYYVPPFSNLSGGWRILIATIAASLAGARLLSSNDSGDNRGQTQLDSGSEGVSR